MKGKKQLIELIKEISKGKYSNDIMALTGPDYDEDTREVAEAVGMMMVKIEAREFHLEELNQQLEENILKTVLSIANALGARDKYSAGHGLRVGLYACRLANRLALSEKEVHEIKIAGILHDIGKIGFSDKVFFNEDTKPTEELLQEIRQHPTWGFEILKDLDCLGPILEYVLYHHERLDGRGYPQGKIGDEIPLGARILSVADCFDAISTDRAYQKGKSTAEALEILKKLSGNGLDPSIVEIFIEEILERGIEDLSNEEKRQGCG